MPNLILRISDTHVIRPRSFDGWKRDWNRRKKRAARIIYKALASGGSATECWHNRLTIWKANDQDYATCFLPQYRTPEHLTDHIVSRMFGFGLVVVVEPYRKED